MSDAQNRYAHRMGKIKLLLLDAGGKPITNREVKIAQTKHKFLFGAAAFDSVPMANGEYSGAALEAVAARFDKFFAIFGAVTLPFYWGRFEPERGKPDTKRLKRAAEWLKNKGMALKGHPLCWHTVTAPWLMELSDEEILKAQIDRIGRDVQDFSGIIDMWDVVNEAVIMPVFDKYGNGITRIAKKLGRAGMVRETFRAAKQANPGAMLLINDFDTSARYESLLEGCLEEGMPIDAIGIQSHMHQGYWGVEKTHRVLERFSRFGLPLHFTESTLVSGRLMPEEIVDLNDYQPNKWPTTPEGEDRQAREAETHYRTLFAHPQVQSVTWWDFTDDAWLNAPAGLLRLDGTAKQAYYSLHNLIKNEWWSGGKSAVADGCGVIEFEGYLGEYEISLKRKRRKFELKEDGATAEIRF